MAYAPHHNGETFNGLGEQVRPIIAGMFREADYGHTFEYAERMGDERAAVWPEFPHLIYVGTPGCTETRKARVLKTVAYIVTDEAADGSPVVEKWSLRGHRQYGARH